MKHERIVAVDSALADVGIAGCLCQFQRRPPSDPTRHWIWRTRCCILYQRLIRISLALGHEEEISPSSMQQPLTATASAGIPRRFADVRKSSRDERVSTADWTIGRAAIASLRPDLSVDQIACRAKNQKNDGSSIFNMQRQGLVVNRDEQRLHKLHTAHRRS